MKNFYSVRLHDKDFPVVYKPCARSQVMRQRYSRCGQRILITGPQRVSNSYVKAFIEKSMTWLHTCVPQPKNYKRFSSGMMFPFLGHDLTIHHHVCRSSSVLKEGDRLHVICSPEKIEPLIIGWIKVQTKTYFEKLCSFHGPEIGVSPIGIRIGDPETRWGSCSSKGTLSFSWRLALAPREVSFYVAVHELSHLREMNHNPAFWRLVASLCPDYQQQQKWLTREGSSLHLWGQKI